MPSFLLLFYLMMWYFKFLLGCLFLLICLPWRPPLLPEKRLSLDFLPAPLQPNCSPFPYWKGSYILGREGRGTFLISIWFVCFDLSLPPNVALGVLGTQNISNLRVGLCFILTGFSLDFQLYSHYSIKDFGFVLFWLDDCLIVSVTIIKCKDFTTLN